MTGDVRDPDNPRKIRESQKFVVKYLKNAKQNTSKVRNETPQKRVMKCPKIA